MKLGVFTALFRDRSFEETCKYLSGLGVQVVELACGGTTGKHHTDPNTIMEHPEKIQEMKDILAKYGLGVSAVSCHGNPVHPNPEEAKMYHEEFKGAILFAEAMGVDTVIGFSGCPGDSEGSKYPNWVTCAWPNDFGAILKYQWEIIIEYWKDMAEFAKAHGIKKIAFEMHPGFCVYNPETLLKLREAVGDIIGANFWAAISGAIYAEIMARVRKYPAITYLVVSVFPLLPGAGVYYTTSYFLQNNTEMSWIKGLETAGIAGVIAIGILIISTAVRFYYALRSHLKTKS